MAMAHISATEVCVVNLLAAIFVDQRINGVWVKGKQNTGIKNFDNLVLSTELTMWISHRKEIHIVNSVDKTKLSCNTPTDAAPQFL